MATTASRIASPRGSAQDAQGDRPVAIDVRGLNKTFRIPSHRVDSLKERALHPFQAVNYRDLNALRDVTFDVKQGEFFGIVGRNGSGKSTLLKILASIYAVDSGSVRTAGRVAPFIELGVGFNPDLTARENVVLNGVMMGLSRKEARRRLGAVLEFAELEEFADLKLKNYSSGMTVRLAFAVMIQADSEILLIDEVLAVGDASFQQKCADVFEGLRESGRTVVLVTHDMAAVHSNCDRALMLEEGRVIQIGNPEDAAREYIRANFERQSASVDGEDVDLIPDLLVRVADATLTDRSGARVEALGVGEAIRLEASMEARVEMSKPIIRFDVTSKTGDTVFSVEPTSLPARLGVGREMVVKADIENPLSPGKYGLFCWAAAPRGPGEYAGQAVKLLDFEVVGDEREGGLVSVPGEITIELPEPGGPAS